MKSQQINPKKIVEFMIVAGKLKWTKRNGWLREKMPRPETVAEHTFRVAILCRILAPHLGLDSGKLTSMAIFHDLAEGVLGDPVTQRGKITISEHDSLQETWFMKSVFKNLGKPDLFSYWKENVLENGQHKTKYSDALYQIGKIATVWQAYEYELRGVPETNTREFWENAEYHVKYPLLISILKVLKKSKLSHKIFYLKTSNVLSDEKIAKQIVEFMIVAGKLKWTKRSGWTELRMPEPESVAEHTFRVTILSRILAPFLNLDSKKITTMAIFHDFAEGIFGDPMIEGLTEKNRIKILDYDEIEKADFDVNETKKFMKKVFENINIPKLYEYWNEQFLEDGQKASVYSDILFQIGKLANVWQAFEYEIRGVPQDITKRFWVSAETYIDHPFLKKIVFTLKKSRKSLILI